MRDLIVKISVRFGLYKKLMDIDAFFINRKKMRNFKKNGIQVFIRLDEVCRDAGVRMIPIFGTQLGLYRENGFIKYDNDIDASIFSWERPTDFDEKMKSAGFELETTYYFKEDNRIAIEQYICDGVHVDINYLFEQSEDDWYCYVGRHHETKDWKEANASDGFPCVRWPFVKCDFVEEEYFGHRFYMATKTPDWLKGVFGDDYMIPDRKWTSASRKTRIIRTKERFYRK